MRTPPCSRTPPADTAESRHAGEPGTPQSERRARDRGLLVLIVEDDPDTAASLAALLRFWGHRPIIALDRHTALEVAEQGALLGGGPDLVVSDINLPDGTGWELMAELSSRFGLRGVALTGYERFEDVQRSREAGFSDHLVKPIDPHRLQVSLERLAAARRR